MLKILWIALASLALNSCMLDSRNQVKQEDEKTVMRKQVQSLQATTADVNSRFQDVEDDVRKANGKIEALETQIQRERSANASNASKGSAALEARMSEMDKAYREEFVKLHGEIDQLRGQASARASDEAASNASAAASKADPFKAAEDKYEKKEYREAILDYERYRKANPKGKQISTATYKIGSAFQELGMGEEARAFYSEVIEKFPKSKDAGRASAKLKSLKKK